MTEREVVVAERSEWLAKLVALGSFILGCVLALGFVGAL